MTKKIWAMSIAAALLFLPGSPALGLQTSTLTGIQQINQDGFGGDFNKYAFSMVAFNDSLYVGTLNIKSMGSMFRFLTAANTRDRSEGAEVWRLDRDGVWTQVVAAGLGNSNNIGVRKMVAALDCIFGVTANHNDGMEVWRSCDGRTWEKVVERGFGNPKNTSGRGLGFFDGYLYVGTENRSEGAELYRSPDGLNWLKVADRGLQDSGNMWVSDFAEFRGWLYMGTLNFKGAQVFRTRNGLHFERVAEKGFEKRTNFGAMKFIVFKDQLLVSTMDFLRGFDLYVSADGVNFTRVLKEGFTDSHNVYLWQMEEYRGRLYAGTYYHSNFTLPKGGFHLFSSEDGITWELENNDGFGTPWHYGVRSMAVFDDKLIIGTASARYGLKVFEAKAKE